ncbi:hypothetical protein C0995_014926 [Termitomyces sp. Mi166|nr:hypothetical protein C0995_014926 [Termitomyces sp. Mi166\
MFEVLWKAEDKLWINFEQVKELNLLTPYLELLGYEKIKDLIDNRIRQPPQDDPQIFLGHLEFLEYKEDENEESSTKTPLTLCLPPTLHSLHLSHISFGLDTTSSMGHPSPYGNHGNSNGFGCPKHHPFITIDPHTHMVMLHDPANLLSPLFATILNLANPDNECQYRLTKYNPDADEWSRVNTPFPNGYLPSTYVDPCFDLLVTLGFIFKQENVNKQTVEDAVCAWCAPSSQRVQHTKQFHAQQFRGQEQYAPEQSLTTTLGPSQSPITIPPPAIISYGLVICSPNHKGKGKAKAIDEEPGDDAMAVDVANVPLPDGDVDAEDKLEDFSDNEPTKNTPAK